MRRVLLAMVLLVGCTGSSKAAPPAPTTQIESATTARTSPTTTTSQPSTTSPPATSTSVAVVKRDPGPCALGTPSTEAEVTFLRSGELVGVTEIGGQLTERCLVKLAPGDTGPVRWGPQGDRVLLGNRTFVVNDTRTDTGFGGTDIVTWSAPKGTALLRLDPAAKQVSKRNNLDNAAITSFDVAEADDALYHPAGKAVVFVGRPTTESQYGIWLMSNEGERPQIITVGEDAKQIRLLGWSGGGASLGFWAEHFDGTTHLHQLQLPGLTIQDGNVGGGSTVLADVQRNHPGAVVTGSCEDRSLAVRVFGFSALVDAWPLKQRDVRVLSIDYDHQVITVATRDTTCDGPEDIWRWERRSDPVSPQLLARGVTGVSVREVAMQPIELPADITGRAPG